MTGHALTAHRAGTKPPGLRAVVAGVELAVSDASLRFTYRVTADLASVAVPRLTTSQRADRLWEHTCFEAFVAPGFGERYYELNFSPSTEWAAYEFESYRRGMRPLAIAVPPAIAVDETEHELVVTADVDLRAFSSAPSAWRIGLAAVVEARAGGRAYFALRHPHDKPDFHDSAAFVATLEGSAE